MLIFHIAAGVLSFVAMAFTASQKASIKMVNVFVATTFLSGIILAVSQGVTIKTCVRLGLYLAITITFYGFWLKSTKAAKATTN